MIISRLMELATVEHIYAPVMRIVRRSDRLKRRGENIPRHLGKHSAASLSVFFCSIAIRSVTHIYGGAVGYALYPDTTYLEARRTWFRHPGRIIRAFVPPFARRVCLVLYLTRPSCRISDLSQCAATAICKICIPVACSGEIIKRTVLISDLE